MIFAFVFLLSVFVPTGVFAKEPFTSIDVPKCEKAPVIDGEIKDEEYKLVASYEEGEPAWKRDSSGVAGLDVKLDVYATWDDEFFYYAVIVTNLDPKYTPGPNTYVFEQPGLMTAMLRDDPTLPEFAEPTGAENWSWDAAAGKSFAKEWTVGSTKNDVEFMKAPGYSSVNHFGAVRNDPNYKVVITHGDADIYEQAIPWAAIGKTEGIEVGGKAGFTFSACVKSVTLSTDGSFICFASGISEKSFERYALVNLTANEPFDKVDLTSFVKEDTKPAETSKEAETTKVETTKAAETTKAKEETTAVTTPAVTTQVTTKEETKAVTTVPSETIEETKKPDEKGTNTAALIGIPVIVIGLGIIVYQFIKKKK